MTQPVRVSISGLRTLGDEIAGHGTELRRNLAAVQSRLVPPAGPGVDGWVTLDATARASTGWKSYLDTLAGRIEASGKLLTGAADGYQEAEQRSTRRLGRVRRMPPRAPAAPTAQAPRSGSVG
ncbi:WXG100 family type VII secretion target [Plantactinospora endophytica]|uniref:ESX-1 secretion-associated protein n=1 Tax=Plantactinospora endophytica TaxID=673535 RepID=A0ABQ4DVZ6_9ACTN|nr:hypothetical protein [Plantactinospora endophytica]GIG86621.1 hypothetical protein Pen02_15570 [Plantactinospora endophytica]